MNELPRLILAREHVQQGLTPKELANRCRSGALVHVRHGAYVDGEAWRALRPWEQYRLLVGAAAETFTAPTVFARHSAASVGGVPTVGQGVPARRPPGHGKVRTVLDLAAGVDGNYTAAAARRIRTAGEFADPRSGSPGESYSRGLMCVAGFQPPELQHEVRDGAGLVGYSDYFWERARLVGEFDGVEKYLKPEYLAGRSSSQAVVDEKERENRIRATGRRVLRWVWADLMEPGRLEQKLAASGAPRRRARSARWP